MARSKKQKTVATPTIGAASLQKIADDTLARNPHLNEVHITSEGTAFGTKTDAENHAKSLKDKTILSAPRIVEIEADSAEETPIVNE